MSVLRKPKTFVLAGLAVAVMLPFGCGGGGDGEEPTPTVQVIVVTPTGPATPRPRRTQTPTPTVTQTPLQVCAPNPDPAPPAQLQVEEPKPNAEVQIPVHVRGWGSRIGENNRGIIVAVVDARQNVLQVNNLPPQPREYRVAPPGLEVTEFTRPFAADIVLNNLQEPTEYCLWIYQETTEEGKARGVVQVPVKILPR